MEAMMKSLLIGQLVLLVSPFFVLESNAFSATEMVYHPHRGTFVSNGVSYQDGQIVNHSAQEVLNQLLNIAEANATTGPKMIDRANGPRSKRSIWDYKHEEIFHTHISKTDKFDGAPEAKSAWLRCETESECIISRTFTHEVSVTHSFDITFGLEASKLWAVASVQHSQSLSETTAHGKSVTYSVKLADGPSEGRLMFTPKLMRILGTVDKDASKYCEEIKASSIFTFGATDLTRSIKEINCWRDKWTGQEPINMVAPMKVGGDPNQIDGVWWVEYKPEVRLKDESNYYNLPDKDYWGQDAGELPSGSPKMCAQSAQSRGVNWAVWANGKCYLKHTDNRNRGVLTTQFGERIGHYNLEIPNEQGTNNPGTRNQWARQGNCDMIQEWTSNEGQYGYYCKKFRDAPGMVMLFRRN